MGTLLFLLKLVTCDVVVVDCDDFEWMWSLNKLSCFFWLFISAPELEMKSDIDRCRTGLRCKHESCRYGCYLSNGVGLTPKWFLKLELRSNYYT